MSASLVGSEMCIRDRSDKAWVRVLQVRTPALVLLRLHRIASGAVQLRTSASIGVTFAHVAVRCATLAPHC
eukprot:3450967-Alexandrium_andersonii.AAC.1